MPQILSHSCLLSSLLTDLLIFITRNQNTKMSAALYTPILHSIRSKLILLLCIVVLIFTIVQSLNQQEKQTSVAQAVLVHRRSLRELSINKYKQARCNGNSNYLQMVSKEDVLARLSAGIGPRGICKCGRELNIDKLPDEFIESFCSDEATLLGENQRTITFSLFYKPTLTWNYTKERYFDGIRDNLRLMKELYPGWVMRVFSNLSYTPEVCNVVCSDENIYFCDVQHLPQAGDVSHIHPMTWRFLAIGDPTVKEFAVRDLDSRLSRRERDAVDQWEESGYPVHGMRDHPLHGTAIMGGMWGADNYKLCMSTSRDIQRNILNWSFGGHNDQQIIARVLYLPYKAKILTHDSFLCEIFRDSVPFPTRRPNDWYHVGRVYDPGNTAPLASQCPPACRPYYGKDWKYC